MSVAVALLLFLLGLGAGGFGALAGVGGGIILTPVLSLYFGVPIQQAIGTSLIAVIATSTATASVYVERHLTDVRLGMTLELATTIGAAIAAMLAAHIQRRTIVALFTVFLLYSASSMVRKAWGTRNEQLQTEIPEYTVRNYPLGMAVSGCAGVISGLLGVGGGPIKVPAMFLFMGVPLRVATATSNFMIGVTAAASAYIYYGRGDVNVPYAAPLVAGVFLGSLFGARLAPKVRSTYVLFLLIGVTAYLALRMILSLIAGKV